MLLTPEYGQRSFERHVFDWQITPFAAVLEYLESDFSGVFERGPLCRKTAPIAASNPSSPRTRAIDGPLDDAASHASYAQARRKFEHLGPVSQLS